MENIDENKEGKRERGNGERKECTEIATKREREKRERKGDRGINNRERDGRKEREREGEERMRGKNREIGVKR